MTESPPAMQQARIEQHLRESLASEVRAGNRDIAMQYARLLMNEFHGAKTYRFLRKLAQGEETLNSGFRTFRIALLSSFSIEFLHDALISRGLASGLRIEIYQAGFASFQQEILNPNSGLYKNQPDLVVLAVEGENWRPEAYGRYLPSDPNHNTYKENFKNEISGLLGQFRTHSQAPILIHDFACPIYYQLGIADGACQQSQGRLIRQLNDTLHDVCSQFVDTHVLRYGDLVSRSGCDSWYDLRLKLYAGFPLSPLAVGE